MSDVASDSAGCEISRWKRKKKEERSFDDVSISRISSDVSEPRGNKSVKLDSRILIFIKRAGTTDCLFILVIDE